MQPGRLFLHHDASVKTFYWGDQKESQRTVFSTPTFICYTSLSGILNITPKSSIVSDQTNVGGDYHVIALITDTKRQGARGEYNRGRQSSGVVICTIHLNSFCSLTAVWKVSGFSQNVGEVFVLPGCCNIHEEQRLQYSNLVITWKLRRADVLTKERNV